jgi:hypothetical protein
MMTVINFQLEPQSLAFEANRRKRTLLIGPQDARIARRDAF